MCCRGDEIRIASYGPGEGKIWINELECTGTEKTIENCNFVWGQESLCLHSADVGLNCGPINESGRIAITLFFEQYQLTVGAEKSTSVRDTFFFHMNDHIHDC